MRPASIVVGLTPADANGICAAQTKTGAGELSPNGALAASVGVARLGTAASIIITCTGDESARTFTVTGKDSSGRVIVEKLTGVSATTVTSSYTYREVSRIEVDAATAGTVSVGVSGSTQAISVLQTPTIASALTITGVLSYEAKMFGIAEFGFASAVKIYSAGNDSGITFTVYGQDGNKTDISEAITGANATTATGSKLFKRVYAIYVSGAAADVVYAGWAEDVDGVAKSQSVSGAGYLVMNGANCGLQARHFSIYAVSDESAKTFTVTGLDRYGDRQTEDIIGPTAGATVKSLKNFSVIQAVYVNAALTGNVTVGSADQCESQAILLNYYDSGMGVGIKHSTSSSLDHRFLSTLDSFETRVESNMRWYEESGVKSSDETFSSSATVSGIRLEVTNHVRGVVEIQANFPSLNG
jgi:hypothetical protein